MAQSIKNRIFGSDVPTFLKRRVEAKQRLAQSDKAPGEQINDTRYTEGDENIYSYDSLTNQNFGGVADLSSRTPSVRMWTALNISEHEEGDEITTEEAKEEWYKNFQKRKRQGEDIYLRKEGDKWREYKWLPIDNSRKVYVVGNHTLNTLERAPNEQVTGDINKEFQADTARYIFPNEQETDRNAFLRPAAGITSVTSATEGTLGALKKTTVNFIVHNFHDFERIYLRYFLKPGAQIFVDFGWDTGLFYNPINVLDHSEGVEDALFGDKGAVTLSKGDLETVFGHVVNYDATIREDGGFDCMVEIVSKNFSLFATTLPDSFKKGIAEGLDMEILGLLASGVLGDPILYHYSRNWGQVPQAQSQLATQLAKVATELVGGETAQFPGDRNSTTAKMALMTGIFVRQLKKGNTYYVNWGWFEDNLLNNELGFADDRDSLQNSDKEVAKSSEKKIFAKYNSRNSYCKFSSALYESMKEIVGTQILGKWLLYPDSWGSSVQSYNIRKGMVPDRYDPITKELIEPVWGDGNYSNFEAQDRSLGVIPLREMFISTELIKDAVKTSSQPIEILYYIMNKIRDLTKGVIDLGLSSNSYGQHTLAFVDRNVVGAQAEQSSYTGNQFLDRLLVFSPYSDDTICKEYSLQFSMPENGLGNMLAIQGLSNTGDNSNIGSYSLNRILDGFLSFEELNRKNSINVDGQEVSLEDKFVRYEPSIGREASSRYRVKSEGGDNSIFSFDEGYAMFGRNVNNKGENAKHPRWMPDSAISKKLVGIIADKQITARGKTDQGQISNMSTYVNTLRREISQGVIRDTAKAKDNNKNKSVASTPDPNTGEKVNDEDGAKEEAQDKGHVLTSDPTDYYLTLAQQNLHTNKSPIIPISANFSIYGMSGFVPGDLIRINYLPDNYRRNVYFQITKVEHDIADSWTTKFETQMRIAPGKAGVGSITNLRITRNYLNGLDLHRIDNWIPYIGNLRPIQLGAAPPRVEIKGSKNKLLSKPKNISAVFQTYFTQDPPSDLAGDPAQMSSAHEKTSIIISAWDEDKKTKTEKKWLQDILKQLKEQADTMPVGPNGAPKISFATYKHYYKIYQRVTNMKKGQVFYIVLHNNASVWSICPFDPTNNWGLFDEIYSVSSPADRDYNLVDKKTVETNIDNNEKKKDGDGSGDGNSNGDNQSNQGQTSQTVINEDGNQETIISGDADVSESDIQSGIETDAVDNVEGSTALICANPPEGGWALTPKQAKKDGKDLIPFECATNAQRKRAGYQASNWENWAGSELNEEEYEYLAEETGYYCEGVCDQCLECGVLGGINNSGWGNLCNKDECDNISAKIEERTGMKNACIFEGGNFTGNMSGTCHKKYPQCCSYNPGHGWCRDEECSPAVDKP